MRSETTTAVLERLEIERPAPDLEGLRSVYAAWCRAVPFDNVLKLIHLGERQPGPLPGSSSDAFFASWLEYGTGGTCWAGNGALHDLLDALGFTVDRAIATMMPSPEVRGPNHGSVIAAVDGERWIVDASILSGEPIRIPAADEPVGAGLLPRFEWLGSSPAVVWRSSNTPGGFPCRIERSGADAEEFEALHARTREWSPFNYELNVRVLRDGKQSVGFASGRQFALEPDGSLATVELDDEGRVRFLVEEIGIAEELVRRVPPDRPVPARPPGR